MKTYSKLEEKFDYDKEQATELAEAMTELVQVERRAEYLRNVVKRHGKLKKFLHGTAEGQVIAVHDLGDDHLQNIIRKFEREDREISPQLKAEARSRSLAVLDNGGLAPLRQIAASSGFVIDEDDLDLDIED